MADNDGNSNVYQSDAPECVDCSVLPVSPPIDGGGEASATVVVENVVEEVVSFIANKSCSVLNNDNDEDGNYEYEFKMRMEDAIKMILNGDGDLAELPVIQEIPETGSINVTLDELVNHNLPSKDSGSGEPSSIGGNESGDQDGGCGCEHEDLNGSSSSNGTTGTTESEDAANVLLLIQSLVNENKGLQRQMAQMKRIMSYVMSRYRKSVTFLLNELDLHKNDYKKMMRMLEEKGQEYDSKLEIGSRNALIAEMKQVMSAAARLDDSSANHYEEKISQLLYENQGLRKIIRIALDYGGEHLLTCQDKCVQTEDAFPEQANVEEELATLVAKRSENLDVYATTYEYDDDGESFHTADSLNGSLPSLNQEPDGTCEASQKEEQATSPPPPSPPTTVAASAATRIGDQDKVEFDAEQVNSVLLEVTSK